MVQPVQVLELGLPLGDICGKQGTWLRGHAGVQVGCCVDIKMHSY